MVIFPSYVSLPEGKWLCQKIHGRKTRTETDVYHQKFHGFIIMFFIETTDVLWKKPWKKKTTNIGQSDVYHHFPSRYARKLGCIRHLSKPNPFAVPAPPSGDGWTACFPSLSLSLVFFFREDLNKKRYIQ